MINPSNTNLDNSEIEISICPSPMSRIGGAEVGVEIKHISTGIIVRSVKMLTFKSSKKGYMSDVTISALEAEIKREYEQDDAKDLIRKFHDMMLGSTVGNINDETAIYPHDIAAIFGLLKIPIKFIDDNGNELAINANGSGISAGILKNIPTNKKYNDDESLQSAVDESQIEP